MNTRIFLTGMNTDSCKSVPCEVLMKLDSGSFENLIAPCTSKIGALCRDMLLISLFDPLLGSFVQDRTMQGYSNKVFATLQISASSKRSSMVVESIVVPLTRLSGVPP